MDPGHFSSEESSWSGSMVFFLKDYFSRLGINLVKKSLKLVLFFHFFSSINFYTVKFGWTFVNILLLFKIYFSVSALSW